MDRRRLMCHRVTSILTLMRSFVADEVSDGEEGASHDGNIGHDSGLRCSPLDKAAGQ